VAEIQSWLFLICCPKALRWAELELEGGSGADASK
jgi:hypothetical protein